MHLLSDQTLSSKDFAENMRTYWNTNFHNYETLFSLDSYYPYGSQCFSNANLYFGINCGVAETPGLLQQIQTKIDTLPTKQTNQFVYKEFNHVFAGYNPTFTWQKVSGTWTATEDLLLLSAANTQQLIMMECSDQYFVDMEE